MPKDLTWSACFSPRSASAPAEASGACIATFVGTAERLGPLERDWSALACEGASPMQQVAWARACIESFVPSGALRLAVLERRGSVRAIAPLVARAGSARLELLGSRQVFEPADFVYEGAAALEALAEALARERIALALTRVPAGSPTVDALRRAYRSRAVVRIAPTDPYPYIALDARWREPEHHFNAGRRSDFRRARRHAEKLGPVAFEVHSPDPSTLEPLLEEACRVEARGWKGARGSALAIDRIRGTFFRRYARYAAEAGRLRLCFMRIAGQAVAMQLAVECDRRFWLLKIGYDEGFAKCSPGTLLMMHTVRYAAERGLEAYEFLGESEPWTAQWTRTERRCVSVRTYPWTGAGLASLATDAAGALRSRLFHRERKTG